MKKKKVATLFQLFRVVLVGEIPCLSPCRPDSFCTGYFFGLIDEGEQFLFIWFCVAR